MINLLSKLFKKILYRNIGSIGDNVIIKRGNLGSKQNIFIGNNVYIGPDSFWDAKGSIFIEDNVIIGPKSKIWTYNHNFKSSTLLPYDEIDILKPVKICRNVWLGMDVSINPGITIGEGAIVAMGSVVIKDVPNLAIIGGNPANVIGYRDEAKYDLISDNNQNSYLFNKTMGLIIKKSREFEK